MPNAEVTVAVQCHRIRSRPADGGSPDARQRIIDAAARLVAERGTAALTLAAVAAAAEVSKGGLLHHFPSKADLLTGIADDRIRRVAVVVASESAAHRADGPGRAYLRAVIRLADDEHLHPTLRVLAAIAAADPVLGAYVKSLRALVVRPGGEESAAISPDSRLRLLADGLWLSQILSTAETCAALHRAVDASLATPSD
jgi:AcrR family transcriptional regulator